MHDGASRALARLDRYGVARGDRILIWARNAPEWVAWLLACFWKGVVVVPIDDELSEAYLASVAAVAKPKLIVRELHHERPEWDAESCLLTDLGDERAPMEAASRDPAVCAADAAAIVFTSGTMSTPRGVTLTHGNVVHQLARFRALRRVTRVLPIRMLGIAPLSHVQGLIVDACIPLWLGLSILYVRDLDAANLIRTIRIYGVTVLATVPRVLQVLTRAVQHLPAHRPNRSIGDEATVLPWVYRRHILFNELNRLLGGKFWLVVVGGAPLSEEDERFWRDAGRIVIQGYGLTETTGIATLTSPYFRPVGSIGKLPRDGSMKIAPDGEVLIRGASIATDYIYAEEQRPVAVSGYLRTGDIVRMGRGGHLFFLGRKDDMIVTSEGFNVFAAEVEAAIKRRPEVRDALVCGKDEHGTQEVHAVLLLRPECSAETLIRSVNLELERHQHVKSWTVWSGDDLPRGALQKVKRGDVVARLKNGSASRPDVPAPTPASPASPAERAVALLSNPASVEDHLELSRDLGLSSLDVVEMLSLIERRHGLVLDNVALDQHASVATLRRELVNAGTARGVPTKTWGESLVWRAIQTLVRPAVVGAWFRATHDVRCFGHEILSDLPAPFVLSAAPHRHWLDVFAVYTALPRRLRSKLLSITRYDFQRWPDGRPCATWAERSVVAFMRWIALPSIFPVTLVPHFGSTRQGLFETARMMHREYVPLTFPKGFHFGNVDHGRHDRGTARLAFEFGVPIVPVWIDGNDQFHERKRFQRARISVHIGAPVRSAPGSDVDDLVNRVEHAFRELSTRGLHTRGAGAP